MFICLATGSASARRVALVIGNADYQVSPLKNPVNDAVDMKDVLEKVGFDVILRTNADKGKMLKAIDAFAKKLKTAEAGLFFYAGHGMQINGANYLIPVHSHITSETDVEYAGVHAGRVLGKMEGAGTKVNIVILDACRDNPFKRSFRTTKKGLARMDAPVGSIIAYATAPGSMAADGESRNGLYTSHLLRLIPRQGLSINELFMAVRKGVLAETNSAQVPWEESSLTGKFFLAGGAATVTGGQTGSSQAVLKIESVPDGADIFIDRRFKGKAPIELSGLEPGTYTASARLTGHKGETRQVSVHKGRTAMLTFYLDPEQSKARLYVTVNPSDARIRILSHALAFTNGMSLSQDRYQLEVSKPGYETRTRWVTIDSNQSIDLNITLKKASAVSKSQLQLAAEQGDPKAQDDLGWNYQQGSGVPKDPGKAVYWYRKSAAQGYANAQKNLGWVYHLGVGVAKDDAKAREWFFKAASQGHPNAQHKLAWLYQQGLGGPKDLYRAFSWYKAAADQNFPPGLNDLGWMYQHGLGVPRNAVKAVEYYRRAADQGFAPAQDNMAFMYMNGIGVPKNYAQAVAWLGKAANQNLANAQNGLGYVYQNGFGVRKNILTAIFWYRKAANNGHALAQLNLAYLYLNGNGVRKDFNMAVQWFKRSARNGNTNAQNWLRQKRMAW